jgi:hypothetical protein
MLFYQYYLDNRYFRTSVYNDNDKSSKVSSWAKVRHGVPQGSVLGLTEIINKTAASMIFTDDTVFYLLILI